MSHLGMHFNIVIAYKFINLKSSSKYLSRIPELLMLFPLFPVKQQIKGNMIQEY